MLSDILPETILKALENFSIRDLQEVRLRRNAPLVCLYKGKRMRVWQTSSPYIVTGTDIEYTLKKATENSLYAYNGQIKQGFITANGGIRLGIAGESVYSDNFLPTTIKNISSINIRVPHEEIDCSKTAYQFIANDKGIKNTLIVSPPGAGKTTFLRDITRKISNEEKIYNCLLVDERFEIASCKDGRPMLDVGPNTDIVSGATKDFAFVNGIRSLRPDVIITDELTKREDAEACKLAMRSGVKVIASIHANNHLELLDKDEFASLLNGKYFERFIVLSNKRGPGTIEAIYDEKLQCIYF